MATDTVATQKDLATATKQIKELKESKEKHESKVRKIEPSELE